MNKTALIIIILIIIIGGFFLFRGGGQPDVTSEAEPVVSPVVGEEPVVVSELKEITVSGTQFSFSPSSLTFTAGEQIRLTFNNVGSIRHNLTIEGTGIKTKTIGGGKTSVIEFTAPTSGTYAIFCSVSGHRQQGMEGELVVE